MQLIPLRHREYRLLFAAQSVSLLGTTITYVALPYQVYELTRSSFAVGLLGLVELVPLLAAAFAGGTLADRVDRRRIGLLTDVALAAGSAALTALAYLGTSSVIPLYVVAAWMAAIGALQRPSLESLVPRLLAQDDMPAAAALGTLRGSISMIAGPALGGVIIASLGLPAAYLADVASYAGSLVCVWLMRPVPPAQIDSQPSVAAALEGLRYARSRQELVGTYVVDFVAMVFGMPVALFPAIADRLGGPTVLGWLYAAPAVGALLASVTSRWTARVFRHGAAVLIAASLWGAAIVGFGFSASFALAWLCLILAGGADAVSGIFRMTIWNQTIPDELRGRLASIEMISYTSGPLLGNLEAGMVAALVGVPGSVISGGVLCIAGVIACTWALPGLARYDATQWRRPLPQREDAENTG
jgi:MFS family permease